MFLEFLVPLAEKLSVLNIFRYITFRTASALVVALLISFLLGPRMIAYLQRLKFGQNIRDDGPGSHMVKTGTPTMGGVLILVAMAVSVLLFGDLGNPYVIIALVTTLQFGIIGFIDDYLKIARKNTKGLSPRLKILMQFVIAVSAIVAMYVNPLHSGEVSTLFFPFLANFTLRLGIFYVPFAALLLIGSTNAVNLTDGLDGLAIGLTIFVTMTFAAMAYVSGHFPIANYLKIPFLQGAAELSVFGGALIGAAVGFLWYNAHPAQIFMGDTGSLALGGALGMFALMLKKELLLVFTGGIFVIEALSVILQVGFFKWKGRRIFRMAPVHHHFELKGWHENKVIIRFWIIGALLAILSLATLKVR